MAGVCAGLKLYSILHFNISYCSIFISSNLVYQDKLYYRSLSIEPASLVMLATATLVV